MLKRVQRGFTLIELMIVVAIIGILALVAIPAFMDYMKKSKKTEASLQLNKIAKNAKTNYITNATFQPVTATSTPASDCCTQNFKGGKRCDAKASDWATAAWQALDFQIDEPFFFQYDYDGSAGTTLAAHAVGDLDCDKTMITYTLAGTAASGNPAFQVTEPAPNSD